MFIFKVFKKRILRLDNSRKANSQIRHRSSRKDFSIIQEKESKREETNQNEIVAKIQNKSVSRNSP